MLSFMKPLLPQNIYPEFKLLKKIKEAEPITHLQSLLLMNFTNSAYAFNSIFFVSNLCKNLIWVQPLKAWDINFFLLFFIAFDSGFPPLAWLFLIMSKGEKRLCYFVIFFWDCWLLNIDLWMLNLQNLLLLIWS